MADWFTVDGAPLPLGSEWVAQELACNFALYSRHATAVTLLLYHRASPAIALREVPLDYLRHKSGRVWHTRIPAVDLGAATHYAYRVEGPFDPGQGHRFDARKVLLDP